MHPSPTKDDTLCVILGGGRGTRLYPLTKMRSKPAVPLGGKYRIIDVPIGNCLNAGLNKIYVVTQFQSASLNQHIQGAYHFDRFGKGFVELLAAEQTSENNEWYQGTADAVRQNLIHFGRKWRDVLILSGDQLYQMDFRDLITKHRESGAPMSIAALPADAEAAPSLGLLKVDERGRVTEFREKPPRDKLTGLETSDAMFRRFGIDGSKRPYLGSMGIYLFNRKVLYDELSENRYVDFGKNLFPACIEKHHINTYLFDGYWEDIGTVKSFHEANLLLAKMPETFSFTTDRGMTYTRPRTLPGTLAGRLNLKDCLVADGSRIVDATLDQCVIGIRSIIGKNVQLSRTLVMGADLYETQEDRDENRQLGRPDIGIGDNVVIENAIVDKNVRIGSDVVLKNSGKVDSSDGTFYAVRDGVLCLFKGAVVPSGTRLVI